MKILYDYQAFTMQYYGGVSKCFCELISNFPKDVCTEIGIVQSNNIHLKEAGLCPKLQPVHSDFKSFRSRYSFKGSGHLYMGINKLFPFMHTAENVNKRESVKLLKDGSFDIFHPTFYDDYFLPYLNGKPFVLTVHDMMPELFPQFFGKNDMQIVKKRKLANKADAIIAVSERTKQDLIDILKIPQNRVTVVYHGGPQRENVTSQSLVENPYFLYMGARSLYKNFQQLIIDFSAISERYKPVQLVCTGDEFTVQEKALIKKYRVSDKVIHLFATDENVKSLYAHALAFVYPSLYEGFGMPILEAFAYGCPVLLNNKSCFPEVAGDAGLFFISDNAGSDLAEKLEMVLNWSDKEREEMIQLGYKRLNFYSWKKSAEQLKHVYKSIV